MSNKTKVLQLPQFAAPFKGSFINSLEILELVSKENFIYIYCFPIAAANQEWMNDFKLKHTVYFIKENIQNSASELIEILRAEKPDIVHTHFEGFDIPIVKAVRKYEKETNKKIKVIWHKRNQFSFHKNHLKKIYQILLFYIHYYYWGKEVNMIYVNNGIKRFIDNFSSKKHKHQVQVIPNGIDVDKFRDGTTDTINKNELFTFGAFGGRNSDKRIDLLLNASTILAKNYQFKVRITKGVDTLQVVESIFGSHLPVWLDLVEQTSNPLQFYQKCSCFLSTSVRETFSNAIAEASIAGIPVIQSNIEGTMWNVNNPSTFIFESLNIEKLVNAMEIVMKYPTEDLKIKCQITQENNSQKYSIHNWCSQILNFYKMEVE